MSSRTLPIAFIVVLSTSHACAEEPAAKPGQAMLREHFRIETKKIADACMADIETLDDWTSRRKEYRRQLLEMLGLDPLPEKTPLNAVVTGTLDHEEFTVEKLHFQSRPRLYVTGNLYIPKKRDGPLPTILYVCGHGRTIENGVSYGNKVNYHHHAVWFARKGYVCLVIDTLQLGEIQGVHHGTYGRQVDGKWKYMRWWNSRGYTPAGVEAWNCVRALDYLESRPEVDASRIGVTGRSGGGAYSWWIAAIDERIQCAVPVAGITDLQNHVVAGPPGRLADGCIEGHCDCMYFINTYRWDFPQVAALVAPRPLLIANSDKDVIFPLDGVVRVHDKVRDIYRLYDKEENLGLYITEGGHSDTQKLRMGAFHWFNRHLKGEDPLIDMPAEKIFEPQQLKVFDQLPADEINTTIHDTFVPAAEPKIPKDEAEWQQMRDAWMTALKEKVFRGWPDANLPLDIEPVYDVKKYGLHMRAIDFVSDDAFTLRLYLVAADGSSEPPQLRILLADSLPEERLPSWLDPDIDYPAKDELVGFRELLIGDGSIMCYMTIRGIGTAAFDGDDRKMVQNRRRFVLLGQTLDGMRAWDIVRGGAAAREYLQQSEMPITVIGGSETAMPALFASLFLNNVEVVQIDSATTNRENGVTFLNMARYADLPQVVTLAAEKSQVQVNSRQMRQLRYPHLVAERLNWPSDQIYVFDPPNVGR